MKIKTNVNNVKATITDKDGNPLLTYSVDNLTFECEVDKLVEAFTAIGEKAMASINAAKTDDTE